MVVTIEVLENEIKNHDARLTSLHKRVGEVQIENGDVKTKQAVLQGEIGEARDDIAELKTHVDVSFKEQQSRFDKKFETLTTAVRWGTGTMVALIGILLTILAKGG